MVGHSLDRIVPSVFCIPLTPNHSWAINWACMASKRMPPISIALRSSWSTLVRPRQMRYG